MRIALFGADGPTCQLDRIKQGFEQIQPYFEIDMNPDNDEPYDLAYCNNPPFDKLLKCHADIKIGNILDIPEHLIESGAFGANDLSNLKKGLVRCDAITAISHTTKNQVKKWLNLNVDKVIYNPIKPVEYQERERIIPFLYVGRANDPNKRFNIIRKIFEIGCKKDPDLFNPSNLAVVGSENPNFGTHVGVISDENLNKMYSQSKFLLFPSKVEGIGLPMIEASLCRCFPIVCNDNKCVKEFLGGIYSFNPNDIEQMVDKIILMKDKGVDELNRFDNKFSIFQPKNVAQSILDVYNKLL